MKSSLHAMTSILLLVTSVSAAAEQPEGRPGEGVLCLWGLASAASEVGRRCPGKNDPAFQISLDESIALLDQYVSVNGHADADAIARFKKVQGAGDRPVESLCAGDTMNVYDVLHAQGGTAILDATRKLVARPGEPTWGDCL